MTANETEGRRVLHVKGFPAGGMGDCSFSMRANLALRFRGVEFEVSYIDVSNKPRWFLGLTEDGRTPLFVDGDKVFGNAERVVEAADKIGTGPTLIRNGTRLRIKLRPLSSLSFQSSSPLRNKDENEEQKCMDELVDTFKICKCLH